MENPHASNNSEPIVTDFDQANYECSLKEFIIKYNHLVQGRASIFGMKRFNLMQSTWVCMQCAGS